MPVNETDSLTVLVADDIDDARIVFKRWLEVRNYRVLEASNGAEAVAVARRACPDIILMDLNMPGMDGLEAAKRIRESQGACEKAPIVAVTAYDTYGIEAAAREAGCDGYLPKPLDFDELDRVLRRFMLGW